MLQSPDLTLTLSRIAVSPSSGSSSDSYQAIGPFAPPSSLAAGAGIDALDTHIVQWATNPNAWANTTTPLASTVVSIDVVAASSQTPVTVAGNTSTASPMVVSFTLPPTTDAALFRCRYWDASSSTWSAAGTVLLGFIVDASSGAITARCGTLHLSEFAADRTPTTPLSPNAVDLVGDAGLLTDLFAPGNLVAAIVVLALLGAFVACWVVSAVWDERRSEELLEAHRQHLLTFGNVKLGLGTHALHLPPTDPRRVKVVEMYKALKVRGGAFC